MKVLFCHDGPLRKDKLNNYYGIAHNDEMFRRYYSLGQELNVLIRVKKIEKNEKNKLSKISIAPFKVIECPNISSLKGILTKRKKAEKIIREAIISSDYIVIRLPSIVGFKAMKYAKKLNKPYIIELVTCPWDSLWNHSIRGKLIAPISFISTKKAVSRATYVVYVTNRFLQNRYPTKGNSLSCSNVVIKGNQDGILQRRLNKIESRRETDIIIIGTTAAVNVKFKGQQYIIKALGKLKEKGIENYEYHLVGDGNQDYLKGIAERYNVLSQVKFLGTLKHEQVFNWLDEIDLYVQPSRQEGLPRALIEAMSRGMPAFGANTAGIPELLEQKYIFSNSRKNINEICDILLSIDKNEMRNQAKRNYKEANNYKFELIENKRKDFFEQFKKDINSI